MITSSAKTNKSRTKIALVLIGVAAAIVVITGALFSFQTPHTFVINANPNPWGDDYTTISSMEHYKSWGTYNVHDPACKKVGDDFYMYSTDAIFGENKERAKEKNVPLGYIQMRKSKDLVDWEFIGWAFPEIPTEAAQWVRSQSDGEGATNIWAPYLIEHNGVYRLYY